MRGEIKWSDYNAATAGIQRQCEALLQENILKQQGISDTEMPDHELGEDGGAAYKPAAKGVAFISRKVTAKKTTGPNGPTSEVSTTTDGEAVPEAPTEDEDDDDSQ